MLSDFPIQLPTEPSYAFETEDGRRFVNLSRDFIALTERDYRHWGSFRIELEQIKTAVEEIYSPPFYERTGLRYQDVIDRQALDLEGVAWNELVQPPIAGLLGSGDEQVRDSIKEIVGTAELEVRDVQGGTVRLQYGLAAQEGRAEQVFGIDADFYTTERSSTGDVLEILKIFNGHAGNLFRWSITDRLRDALRPRGDDDGAGDESGG